MIATTLLLSLLVGPPPALARGTVFEDLNRNGRQDANERGLPGITVSNQDDFTITNARGEWTLSYTDDTIFYVQKPRGYMTPVDDRMLPKFYYIHKPAGSPELRYGGVKPTGPLPASIDFPLYKSNEPEKFKALFFGDTQSRNLRELKYLTDDLLTKVDPEGAMFGVTLGDILFDDLSFFDEHNQAIALIGIPWYNVLGNHDINFDAKHDHHSDETFESFYGPNYYSFDYGRAHFIVLDDVIWHHPDTQEDKRGRYTAGLGARQLAWFKRDLERTPDDKLVVVLMHIPLNQVAEKADVLGMLSERPYSLSVAAHTHFQEHRFFTEKDGFKRPQPHHHVVSVTTCGSWWSGDPDPMGIPHSTMADGGPRGYSVFSFDGNQYSIEFRATNRPASHQMNIYAPDVVRVDELEKTEVMVNVFGGSEKSTVEFRLGEFGSWQPMTKTLAKDPAYVEMVKKAEALTAPFRKLPAAMDSPHLWKATLPYTRERGVVPIHVRTKDMFAQVYLSTRAIRITL